MKVRQIIIDLIPPFLFRFLNSIRRKLIFSENDLFDKHDNIFKSQIKTASHYAEFGIGSSTIWVANNFNIQVTGIDSSQSWICNVKNSTLGCNTNLIHVDLGELGNWGNPVSYEKYYNFRKYIDALNNLETYPDLVLIDGRFRVACFLSVIINSPIGTKIIFDDYINRPKYKIVELFLKPIEINKRQALFVVDKNFSISDAKIFLEKFEFVFA
jgi:hypothetical protein